MHETAIFPFSVQNLTWSSCSSTPISFKTRKFRRFGHKQGLYCVFFIAHARNSPYFHFWSNTWRHHGVPQSRFLSRRGSFGDSHTFKAYIYLIFAWVFRTSWLKIGVLGDKIGEGVVRYWPLMNSFLLLGVLTSVPILVKIDQEMRPWECSQTDTHTHWQTQTDFIICPMLYACLGQIIKYCAVAI